MEVLNVEHYLPLSFQYDCSLVGFDVSMEVLNVEHYLHLSFQYDCSLVGFDVSMEVFNAHYTTDVVGVLVDGGH